MMTSLRDTLGEDGLPGLLLAAMVLPLLLVVLGAIGPIIAILLMILVLPMVLLWLFDGQVLVGRSIVSIAISVVVVELLVSATNHHRFQGVDPQKSN